MFSKILQFYLRFWAKIYLRRAKPKIIAITGSVGKTSTKEAIFEVLKVKYNDQIRKSEGNLNNETGVPLAILGIKKSPFKFYQWLGIIIQAKFYALFGKLKKILVLEMAADKPGDIKYLTSFVKPQIAILTSIGPAHLAAFGTMEKIIQEKTDLVKCLLQDGWAVLNIDDENIKKYSQEIKREKITYAINEKADIEAKNITTEIENFFANTKFQVVKNSLKFRVETPSLGLVGNVYASLAAVAVGTIFGLSPEEMITGLANIKGEAHRMLVVKGKNQSIIIDDSYNANPISMKAALGVLKFLPDPPKPARKIAVLGDMLEIGNISDQAHTLIGQYAREIADLVIGVGDLAQKYNPDQHFKTAFEAANYLLGKIQKNDIILIKASRKIGLEKIVEALKARNTDLISKNDQTFTTWKEV